MCGCATSTINLRTQFDAIVRLGRIRSLRPSRPCSVERYKVPKLSYKPYRASASSHFTFDAAHKHHKAVMIREGLLDVSALAWRRTWRSSASLERSQRSRLDQDWNEMASTYSRRNALATEWADVVSLRDMALGMALQVLVTSERLGGRSDIYAASYWMSVDTECRYLQRRRGLVRLFV